MSRVIELIVARPEDMRALGEALAGVLIAGDVVALTGDLGAGKTTLVQGAARGLGVTDDAVTSPTFTLVREYRGRWPVYHVDVYRLDRIQEVIDLGFEELLDPDGVTFIEWGDAIEGLLPEGHLEVELWSRPEDEGRIALISAAGARWSSRWERLEAATAPWSSPGAQAARSGPGRAESAGPGRAAGQAEAEPAEPGERAGEAGAEPAGPAA
jgi:tRNA threonylcarbamoyladenosine biosynthesis protein TsaE